MYLRTCIDCRLIFDWMVCKVFFFLETIGLGIPSKSSLDEKGKRNLNSLSRNSIHVINILLPVPVVNYAKDITKHFQTWVSS